MQCSGTTSFFGDLAKHPNCRFGPDDIFQSFGCTALLSLTPLRGLPFGRTVISTTGFFYLCDLPFGKKMKLITP
jgi:hypothetical protein